MFSKSCLLNQHFLIMLIVVLIMKWVNNWGSFYLSHVLTEIISCVVSAWMDICVPWAWALLCASALLKVSVIVTLHFLLISKIMVLRKQMTAVANLFFMSKVSWVSVREIQLFWYLFFSSKLGLLLVLLLTLSSQSYKVGPSPSSVLWSSASFNCLHICWNRLSLGQAV